MHEMDGSWKSNMIARGLNRNTRLYRKSFEKTIKNRKEIEKRKRGRIQACRPR